MPARRVAAVTVPIDARARAQVLALDEAHNFLSIDSSRTRHVRESVADHVLLFTATPISRGAQDLLSLVGLLGADNFEDMAEPERGWSGIPSPPLSDTSKFFSIHVLLVLPCGHNLRRGTVSQPPMAGALPARSRCGARCVVTAPSASGGGGRAPASRIEAQVRWCARVLAPHRPVVATWGGG